jgi:hypothetical protein
MIEEIKAIEGHENLTAEEIAAAINASRISNPASYIPVSQKKVKSWLATNGLSERLHFFMQNSKPASDADLTDPAVQQLFAIRSGIDGVLTMHANNELDVSPGSGSRQLIDAAVASPDVPATEADRDSLLTMAYTLGDVTAEQVTEALAADAAETAKEAALTAYREAHSTHVVPVVDSAEPTIEQVIAAFRAAADSLEAE